MKKLRLSDALAQIQRYFHPIEVQATLQPPHGLRIVLKEPCGATLEVANLPFQMSVTPAQIFEMIGKIEKEAEALRPGFLESQARRRISG